MATELIWWPRHGWVPAISGAEGDDDKPADDTDVGPDDDDEEEVRDPKAKIKSLTEANARLPRKNEKLFKALEDAASGGRGKEVTEQLRTSRLETAFLRAVMAHEDRISDIETAWTLGTAKGFLDPVKIADDGTVDGMDDALARLLDRYPYLIDDEDKPEPVMPTRDTGRPPNPRANRAAATAMAGQAMVSRMPALRRR